jgi:membrane protein DedA with SNARE-associated domain
MILEWALPLLATYKYWILFLLFLIEGPVATFFASLLSVHHFFNIWVVIILAITGDVLGDVIHYFLGTRITKIKFKQKLKV